MPTDRESLFPSPDQETKRGGGVFTLDGKPAHWMTSSGSALCARCQTPWVQRASVPCFYPMTLAEAVAETAAFLESACRTTVGITPRESCEQARMLRQVERYGR